MTTDNGLLLDVRDLRVSFVTDAGELPAVDGVSLRVPRGRVVALVGESGCGKSVTALSIMRLIPQPPGRIVGGAVLLYPKHAEQPEHAGNSKHAATAEPPIDLLQLGEKQMRTIRGGRIAMIFQDPLAALNPVQSAGSQILEAVELHQQVRGRAAWDRAVELLKRVGIGDAERCARDYPHSLSGGMQQRVMIAMALACRPSLLIADEPTTALDVTIQAQILELLRELVTDTGMSVLFITHDLGVVAEVADDVYVCYAGRIVEHAPTEAVLTSPLHPYTRGLLRCVPGMEQSHFVCSEPRGGAPFSAQRRVGDERFSESVGRVRRPDEDYYEKHKAPGGHGRRTRLPVIGGQVPDISDLPTGCRFHPRCGLTAERAGDAGRVTTTIESRPGEPVLRRCVESYAGEPSGVPDLRELYDGHHVACWEIPVAPVSNP